MDICDIKLSLNGVQFVAEADFGTNSLDENTIVVAQGKTAHGALHALAYQVEKLAEGGRSDGELVELIREIVKTDGLHQDRTLAANVALRIKKLMEDDDAS